MHDHLVWMRNPDHRNVNEKSREYCDDKNDETNHPQIYKSPPEIQVTPNHPSPPWTPWHPLFTPGGPVGSWLGISVSDEQVSVHKDVTRDRHMMGHVVL